MVDFNKICLETLTAAIISHKLYLESSDNSLESQQKFLNQSAIIRQVWTQVQDREGYRSKYLYVEVFRELEERNWLKSRIGKRRAKLYFPTDIGLKVYNELVSEDPNYRMDAMPKKSESIADKHAKQLLPKTKDVMEILEDFFERSLETEQTLSRISRRFASISTLIDAMDESLADIGNLLRADRVFIIEFSDIRTGHSKLYEWCAPSVLSSFDISQRTSLDWLSWWLQRLASGEDILFLQIEDIPEESLDIREFFQQHGIQSVMLLPLHIEAKPIGVLGIADVVRRRVFAEEEARLVRICSEIISAALARENANYELRERIKELSCLYRIAEIMQKTDLSLKGIAKRILKVLIAALRFPDAAGACITYEEELIATKRFRKNFLTQTADIFAKSKKIGSVAVSYSEKLLDEAIREEPFLREEIKLLEAIAERLGTFIEHVQAEKRIRQQSDFLGNIIESLPYPFYVIDAHNYTIALANAAANIGSLPEGITCFALTHNRNKPCADAEHPCPLEEVKSTKKPVALEHIHYDKDGNARIFDVHGYPILDAKRNLVQMIEATIDITERKQAE